MNRRVKPGSSRITNIFLGYVLLVFDLGPSTVANVLDIARLAYITVRDQGRAIYIGNGRYVVTCSRSYTPLSRRES